MPSLGPSPAQCGAYPPQLCGLDSSLHEASREDLISPKCHLVAISKVHLAKLKMRKETGVYSLPG